MIKKANILLCLSLCALGLVACNGNSGSASSVEPIAGEKGDKGDKGDTGAKGDTGDKGEDGKDGASVLTGTGAPSDSLGNDGDSYIDTNSFNFYVKADGKWTLKGSIKGEDGIDGLNGNKGSDGKNGASILSGEGEPSDEDGSNGDLYLDTTTYDIYKKSDGAWEKTGANIKGEAGEKGQDATPYYSNSFLPSSGGYLYSDKGSYAAGDTIKLTSVADNGYTLDAIEVIYEGSKKVYGDTTGLSDLLSSGIVAKESGYVFKPIYSSGLTTQATEIGAFTADGTYSFSGTTYGSATSGITLEAREAKNVKIVGATSADGTPATTIYVSGKSTFDVDYLSIENVNIVFASDYVSDSSVLEFNGSYASIKNSTIAVSVETSVALNFKCGSFGIKDVTITSGTDSTTSKAYLTTAVLFGETEANAIANVVVDGFSVDNVKKTSYGVYAGSVFKSYWDTKYFNFEIKNSTFGTAATKIGEVWSHFRQRDHVSDKWGSAVNALCKKYRKTSSVKIASTNIYSDLTNYMDDWDYMENPAIITFRLMQDTDDTDTNCRRNFTDILLEVTSTKINDTALTVSNVKYTDDADKFPLVTLYQYYDDDSTWYGTTQINTYQAIYPYATIDGEEAKLANGLYPEIL